MPLPIALPHTRTVKAHSSVIGRGLYFGKGLRVVQFHPLCFDVEVIAFAIALAYAFGGPTAYGIYDIGGAFNRPETVSKAMAEGVDDTSLW